MKANLLAVLAASAVAFGASAQVVTPTFYSEDFVEMGISNNYVCEGWTTAGVDAKPNEFMSQFFNPEEPDYNQYILLNVGKLCIPMCCTNFTPSTEADQWLISPEIEIPANADNFELTFTAYVYTGKGALATGGTNPFRVYVSDKGAKKENFSSTPVFESSVTPSLTAEISSKTFCIPVSGYAGKKVNIAFAAGGENVGMTGFSNISIGNYYMEFDNRTEKISKEGTTERVRVNCKMKTPVACNGFTATLYVNDKKTKEQYYKKDFGGKGTNPVLQLVSFDNAIKITDKNTVNYRLDVLPDYEGAVMSSISGSIGVPQFDYLNNVVIEELTATGCRYCPSGMAALQYYHDKYPGSDTEGKVISIGVHDFMNYYDPMNAGVEDYSKKIMDSNGTTTLPQAQFNRATTGKMPTARLEVEKQILKKSYNQVQITSVEYPIIPAGQSINGKPLVVKYNAKNAFTAQGLAFRAAVVLIENNVTGNNSGYSQENEFSSYGPDYIETNYFKELVPYMTEYLSGGKLGYAQIPFDKMVYQHVCRGCWPNHAGELIPTDSWVADEYQPFEMVIEVPKTVNNFNNVEAIVMMMDAEGTIVGSDIMPYEKFVAVSGVGTVENDNVNVARVGDDLHITADNGSRVAIYSVDGALLGSYTVANGELTVNGADFNGMVIVKVSGENASVAKKLLF